MPQKMTFGNPWMGQDDRYDIDTDPHFCTDQDNLRIDDPGLLQRRLGLTKSASSTNLTPMQILPLSGSRDTYSSGGYLYNQRFVIFDNAAGCEVLYQRGGTSDIACLDAMRRSPSFLSLSNSRMLRSAWINDVCGILQREKALLLISNDDNPGYRTSEGLQMLAWEIKDTGSPTMTKLAGGKISDGYIHFKYRIELRDSSGIMRMCSKWRSYDTIFNMGSGYNSFRVTTPYKWVSSYNGTHWGICTTATPASWSDSYNWNMPVSGQLGSWNYYIVVARSKAIATSDEWAYYQGPWYLAEEKPITSSYFGNGDTITIDVGVNVSSGMSDNDLTTEYDVWVDPFGYFGGYRDCTDICRVNGVFAWIKNTTNGGYLWWGSNEYPYFAYPENFIPVERYSVLVPLTDGSLAVIKGARSYIIRNLPDTPIVEEFKTDIDPNTGGYWHSQNQTYLQTIYGQVFNLTANQPLFQGYMKWNPYTFGASGSTSYQWGADQAWRTLFMRRVKATSTAVTDNAAMMVRTQDNAMFACKSDDLHYSNELFAVKPDKSVWVQSSNLYDDDGETQSPIQAYWQSDWQTAGTSQYKKLTGVSCQQEIDSQCMVTLEVTDNPADGASGTTMLTVTSPRDLQSVNRTAKYFRIKISSIDGQPFEVREVGVYYDIETSKNGLR